jgi:DNA-binding HxlR family transcriptional regulator
VSTKPTDTEIIGALASRQGCIAPTYYVKNLMRSQHPGLTTAWVLRRLKALEKAGLVKRAQTTYATMLCWEVAPKKEPTNV